ncbi:branched-chain amino acid transaminase [bacterium AH-315-J21]|nr:branched-chain amino acid transaminase [bacterium AH-315-J21]
MAFDESGKIWQNGKLVDWQDAKIHVLSHVVSYGSSVFEGQRCYKTATGSACFRLDEHIDRLFNSAKVYRMDIPYTKEVIREATLQTIAVNNLEACYIRPIVYRGYESLGVDPRPCPIDVVIAVWNWGKYLGPEALEEGVDVCVSSWTRIAPNTLPAVAKAGANYMNSQLIKQEAIVNGYSEGIALDVNGYVSEGSGENIFLVRDGALYTPALSNSVLPGITRDCIMKIANDLGIECREEGISRGSLYIADEVFFTGTAAEITPIRSIDRIAIGDGSRGPITKRLQDEFFAIIEGRVPDRFNWLTPVAVGSDVAIESNVS